MRDLAKALGWSSNTYVYMLLAYLDDSAVHFEGNSGFHNRVALGGGVAQLEVWQEIAPLWQARLQNDPRNPSKVEWFHYKDWKRAYLGHAKQKHQFYGWGQPELEKLLLDLTQIVAARQVDYLCASVPAVKSKRVVRDSYLAVTTDVINRAEQIADRVHQTDTISLMFSMHSELAGIRIQKYFAFLKKGGHRVGYCVIGDPRDEPALQAADLIVNEMATSRFLRASFGPKLYMPFQTRVMEMLRQQPPWHHMIELHKNDDYKMGA